MKRVQSIVLLVTIVASVRAFGASVWVKSSADAWARWSDASVWYADQALTMPLGRVPGSGDSLGGLVDSYVDLEGGEHSIGLSNGARLYVTNGVLNTTFSSSTSRLFVYDGMAVNLLLSNVIGSQQTAEGANTWTVYNGGKLKAYSSATPKMWIENVKVVVEAGGEYVCDFASNLQSSCNRYSNQYRIEDSGFVSFPNGIH